MRFVTRIAIVFLLPALAHARPISYPGGWMAMTMNDQQQYSGSLSYSPTARDAFGVRSDLMREDEEWLHTVTYNRLLKRWNAPGSQGNIYLLSGFGAMQQGDNTTPAATFGMEADWESRRYYVSYENRAIEAGSLEQSFMQKARVGVAPTLVDYGGVQPWLMLQVDHQPSMRNNIVMTPLVRLFTPHALAEVGISTRGDVMANATFQF